MNTNFDYRYISLKDLAVLHTIVDGQMIATEAIPLLRRGYVRHIDHHRIAVTELGHWAMNGIFAGAMVRVTEDYKLPYMRGAVGRVLGVMERALDKDGWDENGIFVKRAKPAITVEVKMNDSPGVWCFYKSSDLEVVFETGEPNHRTFRVIGENVVTDTGRIAYVHGTRK